jgi:hypothetical protein
MSRIAALRRWMSLIPKEWVRRHAHLEYLPCVTIKVYIQCVGC